MVENHDKPGIKWNASKVDKEWHRFNQHCSFTYDGPLAQKTEREKLNYLMLYTGDKGREIYTTFQWRPAQFVHGAQ